jgi:type III secretion system chaperone SycN
MLDREIAEFGRRMDMPDFALSGNGIAALDVEGVGRFFLERNEDSSELLVYLTVPVPAHDTQVSRRVLELCSYKHAHPIPLVGGVHAGFVMLLARLPERMVTAAALENTAHFLREMMGRVHSAGG